MIDNNIVLQQFGGASNANKAEKKSENAPHETVEENSIFTEEKANFWKVMDSLDEDKGLQGLTASLSEDEVVNYYGNQIFGEDEKGEISSQDFFKAVVENGLLNENDVAELEAMIDKNSDGKFTRDEVESMIREMYTDPFGETETETINDIVTETETVIINETVYETVNIKPVSAETVTEYIDTPPELDPNE